MLDISIHALVKRATCPLAWALHVADISIHALVKRATHYPVVQQLLQGYFNPRPREEGDFQRKSLGISTEDFNPRPREEGDLQACHPLQPCRYFNPRPREEGDGTSSVGTSSSINFNPRPREEGDSVMEWLIHSWNVFQSTPS